MRLLLFLLPHRSVALVPTVLPHSGRDSITTTCTLPLLLMIRMTSTSTTSDMGGLLPLPHTWSSLRHALQPHLDNVATNRFVKRVILNKAMVSTAANIGNSLTKDTIDEAIESLKEVAVPSSESIIVA